MYRIDGKWGEETVITKDGVSRLEYRVVPSQGTEGMFVLGRRDPEVSHGTVWSRYLDKTDKWVSKETNVFAMLREFPSVEAVIAYLEDEE